MDLNRFRILHQLLWPTASSSSTAVKSMSYKSPVIIEKWSPGPDQLKAVSPHPVAQDMGPMKICATNPSSSPISSEIETYTILSLAGRLSEWLRDIDPIERRRRFDGKCLALQAQQLQQLLPCGTSKLLVRPAYQTLLEILLEADAMHMKQFREVDEQMLQILETSEASDDILKLESQLKGHILVTGQPGIGKSFFLSFVLVHRLLNGQETVFHAGGEPHYYFFNKEGVHAVKFDNTQMNEHTDDPSVWALVDQSANTFLWRSTAWLVILASNSGMESCKQFEEEAAARPWYLELWKWEEIRAAHYLMYPDASQDAEILLRGMYDRYGAVPRLILKSLHPYNMGSPNTNPLWKDQWCNASARYESELELKIAQLVRTDPHTFIQSESAIHSSHVILVINASTHITYSTHSHRIGQHLRSVDQCTSLSLATQYIGHKIGELEKHAFQQDIRRTYELFLRIFQTEAAEWIFQGIIHQRLRQGTTIAISPDTKLEVFGTGQFSSFKELGTKVRKWKNPKEVKNKMLNSYFYPDDSFGAALGFDGIIFTRPGYFVDRHFASRLLLLKIAFQESYQPFVQLSSLVELYEHLPPNCRDSQWVLLWVVPPDVIYSWDFFLDLDKFMETEMLDLSESSGTQHGEQYTRKYWERKIIQDVCTVPDVQLWDPKASLGSSFLPIPEVEVCFSQLSLSSSSLSD